MEVETITDMKDRVLGNLAMEKVKRPMNAFLIFCKNHRASVHEKNPQLDNRSVTRLLADMWTNMDASVKANYKSVAKQDREAFLKAHPDYKWHNPDKQVCGVDTEQLSDSASKPENILSTDLASAYKSKSTPLTRPLSLLWIAGQQALSLQAQQHNKCLKYDVMDTSCDELPIDLSQSSTSESIGQIQKDLSMYKPVDTLCDSSSKLPLVNPLPSVGISPLSSQPCSNVSPSAVSHCQLSPSRTANVTWPDNGISTYHLVSSIFDTLINSVYGLQSATATITGSGDIFADSPSKLKSPLTEYSAAAYATGSAVSKSDDNSASKVQFPKTKKQMAVHKCHTDQQNLARMLAPAESRCEDDNAKAEFEELTLGELQEKLITKVVENCSISRLLELGSDSDLNGSVVHDVNRRQLPHLGVHTPVSTFPSKSSPSKSTCTSTMINSSRVSWKSEQTTSKVSQGSCEADSRMMASLLELRPLLTQSDVHEFIERVITEKSVDLDDFCTSRCPGLSSTQIHEDKMRSGCTQHTRHDSSFNVSKSGDSPMLVDPVSAIARQTLQEINPNKQSVNCTQYHTAVRHCEGHVDASLDASSSKDCIPVPAKEISQSLAVDTTSTNEYIDKAIDKSAERKTSQNVCSKEINNNQQHLVDNFSLVSTVSPKSGLRKSKRCNRGQRYQELVLKGVLHQTRKRNDINDLNTEHHTGTTGAEHHTGTTDAEHHTGMTVQYSQAVSGASSSVLKIPAGSSDAHPKQFSTHLDTTQSTTSRTGGLNVCEMWSLIRRRSAHGVSSSMSSVQSTGSRKRKPSKSCIVQYATLSTDSQSNADYAASQECKRFKNTAEIVKRHSCHGINLNDNNDSILSSNDKVLQSAPSSSTGSVVVPVYCSNLAEFAGIAVATKKSSLNVCSCT